eukprot:1179168-Rhodomonas_salina.1
MVSKRFQPSRKKGQNQFTVRLRTEERGTKRGKEGERGEERERAKREEERWKRMCHVRDAGRDEVASHSQWKHTQREREGGDRRLIPASRASANPSLQTLHDTSHRRSSMPPSLPPSALALWHSLLSLPPSLVARSLAAFIA